MSPEFLHPDSKQTAEDRLQPKDGAKGAKRGLRDRGVRNQRELVDLAIQDEKYYEASTQK